jgi:hypothetical protein
MRNLRKRALVATDTDDCASALRNCKNACGGASEPKSAAGQAADDAILTC